MTTAAADTRGAYKRLTPQEFKELTELKERAKGQWPYIFEDLAPELAEAMANAPDHVACPNHGGFDGFRLFEHYPETGRAICNTCGPMRSGFETLVYAKQHKITEEDARRMVAEWLKMDVQAKERKARAPVVFRPKIEPSVAYKLIADVWRASKPLAGSPAERYLLKRGIWQPNLSPVLRSHDGLVYVHGKEKTYYGTFPCLLAPIKDKENKLVSVHRIFVTPDGAKAPVPDCKKMMPACAPLQGTAVKLWPAEGDTLGVAEGIETALAAHAVSRMPVWSGVSAVLMEQMDIPAHVKRVVIWADLDLSERGARAAEVLAERLEREGKIVEVYFPQMAIPEGGKTVDWLDVMVTQGINGFPAKWRRWRPEMMA